MNKELFTIIVAIVLALMPLACSKADSPGHLKQAESDIEEVNTEMTGMDLPSETLGYAGSDMGIQTGTDNLASTAAGIETAGKTTTGSTKEVVTPKESIQDAVDLASSGDQIFLTKGTWTEDVAIDTSLSIAGIGSSKSIVTGTGTGSVFTIGSEADVTLSKITITGGNANAGGGIYNEGTLSLNDVSITGNTAIDGGGVYIMRGTVTMNSGSSITSNTALFGGGISVNSNDGASLTMNSGSSISGNTAYGIGDGGAISGIIVGEGGGIYNWGTVTMNSGSSVSDNTAYNGGGGIMNHLGTVNMNGGSVDSNDARVGGGIYNWDGIVNLNGGSIRGNLAGNIGGGIYNAGTIMPGSSSYTQVTNNSPDDIYPQPCV
jgi:hypothetical protein